MSHSSKLMTLDAMIHNLACLRQFILSEEITVSDYLKLFDALKGVELLKDAIEDLRLVLEVDDGQETAQKAFDFLVERTRVGQRDHSDDSLIFELSSDDFTYLLGSLRNPLGGAE